MSQVGYSRPPSQQVFGGRLPEIQHPLSRLSSPGNLDVRGHSRGGPGDRPGSTLSQSGNRPFNENPFPMGRRSLTSSQGRVASRLSRSCDHPPSAVRYDAIPENVEVMAGDPTKARLPVFGNRPAPASRDGSVGGKQDLENRVQSRLSTASAQARLEIDEIEATLKERVSNSYHELKKRFKDNDPEQIGNVSRDGLFRILVTYLGRPLTPSQYSRLLERLGFQGRQVIPFPEFFARFRDSGSSEYPRWLDPVQRQWQERATMTAAQVHAQLKEKAKQRVLDLADLVPQCNPDGSGHILKPEFLNALNKLGFCMDPDEFERLWAKYDTNNDNTINGQVMMQKLGISINQNGSAIPRQEVGSGSGRPLRKKEQERQRSLDIEKWLKKKFREGFLTMKEKFEACDRTRSGNVTHGDFLRVLSEAGLTLEKDHLAEFLARCSIQPDRTSVPYREFLHRFLDRSEDGMAHTILTNPKHRYNRADSPGASSTLSALETQMMNMFQRDFLALLGTFHNIDKLGLNCISQEEFRAAIESRFDLEMSEAQFSAFIDKVPLDREGNVKYADFMAQFDTKGKAPSLFDTTPVAKKRIFVGALPRDKTPSPPPGEPLADVLVIPEQEEEDLMVELAVRRSPQELFKIIKDLMKKDYQGLEEAFCELDEINSRRFSQETMFKLLRRLDVQPEVSRGEIRDLWQTFITNQDKTLDFHEFTRHFGYSPKSAAFPNAKIVPPRRGDSDFMMRSRKLNSVSDMLQDTLRAKVDYMWEEVYQELAAMDKYSTGAVSAEEFRAVLTELCVNLSNYEIDLITNKFRLEDGRVSFVEFLKPFAMKRQVWRHGNNMLSLLQHPNPALAIPDIGEPPQKGLTGITTKLRQKLSGEWKNLRRAFKRLDINNEGLVSLPEFRKVLQLANVALGEEDVYQLLDKYDTSMTGKISYNLFLDETCKPTNPRDSPLRHSANI